MKKITDKKPGSVYAIIAAAGRSSRMGGRLSGINKVYADIDGKPALVYSIEKFVRSVSGLKGLIVLTSPGDKVFCEKILKKTLRGLDKEGYDIFAETVPGGAERFDSILNGIEALQKKGCGKSDLVFIHDGARPNFPQDKISEMLDVILLKKSGRNRVEGVTLALGSVDTLCRAGSKLEIEGYENRSEIWRIQTPQLFRFETLCECAANVSKIASAGKKIEFTDETSLLFNFNKKCVIVEGSVSNIKITSPEDLDYIRGLME